MKFSIRHRVPLFAMISILAGIASASDRSDHGSPTVPRFVHGSWVNVRSLPAMDADIIDHITANTPVRTTKAVADKEFCEITYGNEKHGYISCRLIGDNPLSIADIGIPYDAKGNNNPSYSATRVFWIQPSVDHLLEAGKHFQSLMLKPGEREIELESAAKNGRLTKVRRFPIPEYEAMKALLKNGVMGFSGANQSEMYRPPPKWKTIKEIAARNPTADRFSDEERSIYNLFPLWGYRDVPLDLIHAVKLPSVRASYFKDGDRILLQSASTEMASLLFNIPYRAEVKSGPKWIPPGHYNDGYLFGAWDVGAVETRLVLPVHKHTIFRDGEIVSELSDIPGGRFPDKDADGNGCDPGFAWGDAGASILRAIGASGLKPGKRLFYFFSGNALPERQATVVHNKQKFTAAGFTKAETFEIDIDKDGIADILVWEGTGISKQEIHDPGSTQANFRMVFFNIEGEWHLFLVDEFLYGCGC